VSVTTTELWQMGAIEPAAAIRFGPASCQEVLKAHLGRIEVVNPSINAMVIVTREQAGRGKGG
jgi:Asp-tRNA(Asn)/Glu-tRNA(Gln) amidotransferase A subunit family amidase